MSGDYSRNTFAVKNHFSGVLMQQGRVQLDADWNEWVDILDRRLRAETTDIIGRCVVPKETPDGFRIQIAGGTLTIGRGRMYVHGLPAENFGKAPLEFDPILAEERGTVALPYAEQPYFPNATPLPQSGGPHLVYLDVWQREVTSLEKPDLIEKAVGVDTTTRLQTVWQVKVLPNVGATVTCATPDTQIPGWLAVIRPSAGRLTTKAVDVPGDPNPCLIPPTGGYKGLENQLYRVEIHDQGLAGTATFKWSRDNATIATAVTAIPAPDTLTVVRTGRDAVLRFNIGDWVEITDDWRACAGQPGVMRKVQNVDEATQTLTLTSPLPADVMPTGTGADTLAQRHTRVRRWDQKKQVKDTNGNLLADLDAPAGTGVIPVPAAGTSIVLENGVQITFHTEPAGGALRVGDYWMFAARTADASVEELDQAPPRGIHHHYGRLALVTFPASVTDCRTLWPPEVAGEGCDCSVCVTAESHNGGVLTIQRAVDQVKDLGGTVCLGPGVYNLGESSVRIDGAQSVRVKGHGVKTQLLYAGPEAALVVENSQDITLEELAIQTRGGEAETRASVVLRDCIGVTLQRCLILQLGARQRGGPAIGMTGRLFGVFVRENALIAPIGVGALAGRGEDDRGAYLFTVGLFVQDNFLFCQRVGIDLDRSSLHFGETRLAGNCIFGCTEGGIGVIGMVLPGSHLDVDGNELHVRGPGIVVGTDNARITGNDISPMAGGQGENGIMLVPGLDPTGLDRCQVIGNRITKVAGHGIALQAVLHSVMIKQNVIEEVGGGGIVMEDKSSVGVLSIENNQLLKIAQVTTEESRAKEFVGIRVVQARHAEVVGNTIVGVGQEAELSASRVGIQVIAASSMRIAGNAVEGIGPAQEFVGESIGIAVVSSFNQLEVVDNTVRRSPQPRAEADGSRWYALHTQESTATFTRVDEEMSLVGNRLRRLLRGREMMAIRGNLLEAYGGVPTVDLTGRGACVFTDNRCLSTAAGNDANPPVAVMVAEALIASSNYVRGQTERVALEARVRREGSFTVLGNITSGPIVVNGAVLSAPWAPLNVIAP